MFSYIKPEGKMRILFGGFARAIGIGILTSAALFVVGLALSLMGNAGWIHLGEDQPWMPIVGLVGAVVCWKHCRSRLQDINR